MKKASGKATAGRTTRARWPLTGTNQPGCGTALDLLDRLILEAASRRAPNFDRIVALATRCAANSHRRLIPDARHLELVRDAYRHAENRRWFLAARLLDH